MRSLVLLTLCAAIALGAIVLLGRRHAPEPSAERASSDAGTRRPGPGPIVLEPREAVRAPLPGAPPASAQPSNVVPSTDMPRPASTPLAADPSVGARLVGRVTRDGRPAGGAAVTARLDLSRASIALGSTHARADGEYLLALDALAALSPLERALGIVRVRAHASGVGIGWEDAPWASAADDVLRIDVELELETMLVGRIESAEGEPVTEATLVLEWLEDGRSHEREETVRDPLGAFEIEVEEPGVQRLHASAAAAGRVSVTADDVALGDVVDLGVLTLEPTGTLQGRVVAADGTPIPGCWVEACRTDPTGAELEEEADVWSGSDGSFRFADLQGDWWRLSAGREEQPGPIRVGSRDVELVVTRPTLSVRVTDPAGNTLRGVEVDVSADAFLAGVPPSERFHGRYVHVSYEAPDGTVHKTFYEPYSVVLFARHAVAGEMWTTERRVDVQPGYTAITLVLEPRALGASVTVDVRGPNGRFLDGARVSLVSNETGIVWDHDVRPGELVPAGSYTLRAAPRGESLVPPFERTVVVPDAGAVTFEMRASRAGGRVELVLVASGARSRGDDCWAAAWLLPEGVGSGPPTRFIEDRPGGFAGEGLLADRGYFTESALPAGRYRLELRGNVEPVSRSIEVREGRTTPVSVAVRPR